MKQLDNWIEGDGKGQHDADLCNHIKNLCHFPKPVVTSKLQGEPKQPIHFGVIVRLYPKVVPPPHEPNSNVYTSTS